MNYNTKYAYFIKYKISSQKDNVCFSEEQTNLLNRLACFLSQLSKKVISDSKQLICFITNVVSLR